MLKTIKIVSRASHLARVQAYKVGAKIQDIYPTIDIEYCSKKSEGDINPNQSISSGEITGLFTHNISNSISDGEFDIGVHSWKDVPLEPQKILQFLVQLSVVICVICSLLRKNLSRI